MKSANCKIKKRGYAMLLDVMLAVLVVLVIFAAISNTQYFKASKTTMSSAKDLHYTAEDVLDTLNKNEVLDIIGEQWAAAEGNSSSSGWQNATNITREYLDRVIPWQMGYAVIIDDREVYSTDNDSASGRPMRALAASETHSTRLLVGYSAGLPTLAHVARAFLNNIQKKTTSDYIYFGGFVGQGKITSYTQLPEHFNITSVYMELDAGDSFNLFVNEDQCGTTYTPTASGNMTANVQRDITACTGSFRTGDNKIEIDFTGGEISNKYIGGGFIRVQYTTDEMAAPDTGTKVEAIPGIEGVVNLYSSFYVPGNLASISAHLHFRNNYTTFFNVGNRTILEVYGGGDQVHDLGDAEFSGLDYAELSSRTVPFRIGSRDFPATIGGVGTSDSVIVTDVSGSMNDCDVSTNYSSSCPLLYHDRNINVAKNVDNQFVDRILEGLGNRVGLVSYDSVVDGYLELTNNNASLHNEINTYGPGGATCISCGIKQATDMLVAGSTDSLIVRESTWRSLANGTPPSGNWTEVAYDDSGWGTTNTPLSSGGKIALIGDYSNQLRNLLQGYGYNVTQYNRWDCDVVANNLEDYDAVVIHGVYNNNEFNLLLNETNARGKGIVFASSDPVANYGMGMLRNRIGDPSAVGSNKKQGDVKLKVLQAHPIFEGYAVNQNVTIITGGARQYQYYTGYSGTNIGSSQMPGGGYMIGYNTTAGGSRRVIMGSFGARGGSANFRTDVNDWTNDGKKIFNNSVRWAARGDTNTSSDIYFRKNFTVQDPADIALLTVYVRSDDRADVYLNGNMVDSDPENHTATYWNRNISVNTSLLVAGENVVAVRLYNDGTDPGFDLELTAELVERYKAMLVMSDGEANYCIPGWYCASNLAKEEAVEEACDARSHNITAYSVAFGTGAGTRTLKQIACWNCSACAYDSTPEDAPANCWLAGENYTNCSRFYESNSAEELETIYNEIAEEIVNATYVSQLMNITGNKTWSTLYPDSTLTFTYEPESPLEYGSITITYQTDRLNNPNCNGTFEVPQDSKPVEAVVTSFSSAHWTDLLSSNGADVYSLRGGTYGVDYTTLGDPFIIYVPAANMQVGNNTVIIRTGDNPTMDTNCSLDDRVIYTVMVKGYGIYGGVLPEKEGCHWTIKAEDGTMFYPTVPKEYNGSKMCSYLPGPGNISYNENDSIDEAVFRLMDQIDLDNDGLVDIEFDPDDLEISYARTGGVRSLWGPIRFKLVLWM